MKSNPSPGPKRRYNRQEDVLRLLIEAFPGSKIVNEYGEVTNHPLNTTAAAPKKKRRRKRDPGEGQEGLF